MKIINNKDGFLKASNFRDLELKVCLNKLDDEIGGFAAQLLIEGREFPDFTQGEDYNTNYILILNANENEILFSHDDIIYDDFKKSTQIIEHESKSAQQIFEDVLTKKNIKYDKNDFLIQRCAMDIVKSNILNNPAQTIILADNLGTLYSKMKPNNNNFKGSLVEFESSKRLQLDLTTFSRSKTDAVKYQSFLNLTQKLQQAQQNEIYKKQH